MNVSDGTTQFDEDEFKLSNLGLKSAHNQTYFEPRKGILKIQVLTNENEWVPLQIVKIEESKRYNIKLDKDENGKIEK